MNQNSNPNIRIYDGRANETQMFKHILSHDLIRCCNQRLYYYNEYEGRYASVPRKKEWHYLSRFFSDKINTEIPGRCINELITRLMNNSDIQIDTDEFNSQTDLINVRNGVLDYKSGKLLAKSPKYLFNYMINASYNPHANINDAPMFKSFCNTSLDGCSDKIKLLLQIIGYLCSSLTEAKKCFILIGAPDSGKSLIIHLMEYLIGSEFTCNIQLENLSRRFSTAELSTKFLNICGELSARPLRNIETFKLIVGGDTLSGEFKGQPMFYFKNKCKLLYAGNVLPPIKNEDISLAFVNRLILLCFSHSIPKSERIYDMADKLKDEADTIFSLGINELSDLIETGYRFAIPDDSAKLLSDYAFEQTNIDSFIEHCCIIGSEYKIHTVELYKAYTDFCTANAVSPISQNLFSQKIASLPNAESSRFRINGGPPTRGFKGIGLNDLKK